MIYFKIIIRFDLFINFKKFMDMEVDNYIKIIIIIINFMDKLN